MDKYDTLEYSWVKARAVSMRLRIYLCALTNTNNGPAQSDQLPCPSAPSTHLGLRTQAARATIVLVDRPAHSAGSARASCWAWPTRIASSTCQVHRGSSSWPKCDQQQQPKLILQTCLGANRNTSLSFLFHPSQVLSHPKYTKQN